MISGVEDSSAVTTAGKDVTSTSKGAQSSSGSTGQTDGVISVTRNDSFNSVNSDHYWADKSRVVTFRASNPEVLAGCFALFF